MAEIEIPVDSNQGEIKTDPVLSTESATVSASIANNLGIDLDPVKSFTPNQALNAEVAPTAKATRQIANESDVSASLVKPGVKDLNTIEAMIKNSKIELDLADKRRASTTLVIKQMKSNRVDGELGLTPQEELDLINIQEDVKELNKQREDLKLNTLESVVSGDLLSVFNDTKEAAKESPWATGSLTVGGFLAGGPAGAMLGFNIATSVGNASYQFDQAAADTYLELDGMTDDLGNPLDDTTKTAIALTSGVLQGGLELGADAAASASLGILGKGLSSIGTRMGFKVGGKEISKKITEAAVKDIPFRNYIKSLVPKMIKQGGFEALTEVLQDNTGAFAKALGQTWTQEEGLNTGNALKRYGQDFDISQNANTALRAGLTGALAVGSTDIVINRAAPKAWGKAKSTYNKMTGKNINLGTGDSVEILDDGLTPEEQALPKQGKDGIYRYADGSEAQGPTSMVPVVKPQPTPSQPDVNDTYKMVDGRPVGLDATQFKILTTIIPAINSVRGTSINADPEAASRLQEEQARQVGLEEVYMDKELISEWADTPDKQEYVDSMMSTEKGVHVDGQRVRLTREQYFGMQKFGNVKFITYNTAVTSDGATLSDIKKSVDEKKAKTIPKAGDLPSSPEVNTTGNIDLTTEPEVSPTANLGMDSTIEEVKSTLKNKQQADEYLQRLQDEETNLSTQPQESTEQPSEPVGRERTSPIASEEEIDALAEELYYNDSPQGQMDGGGRFTFGDDPTVSGEASNSDLPAKLTPGKNKEFRKAEDIYQERLDMYKRFAESPYNTEEDKTKWKDKYDNLLNNKDWFIDDVKRDQQRLGDSALRNALDALKDPNKIIEPDYNVKSTKEQVSTLPVKTVKVRGKEYKIHTEIDYNNQLIIVATDGEKIVGDLKLHFESYFNGKNKLAPKFISGQVPGVALELMRYARENIGYVNDSRVKTPYGKTFAAKASSRNVKQGIAKYKAQAEQMLKSEPTWVSQDQMGFDDVASNQSDRLNQIKEMRERVNAIRDELPDYVPTSVDQSIEGFEEFGVITENILAQLTPEEQADYNKLVDETKREMKEALRMSVVKEMDRTSSMIERDLNTESDNELLENIMNNPETQIVDWFMADETLAIDPDSLTENQKKTFLGNQLLKKRKVFKKGGVKLQDVAAGFDVQGGELLEILSESPSSEQAFKAQRIIEQARNEAEARKAATPNQSRIDKIIDNKLSLKRKLLEAILKADPRAGLKLIHNILKQGDKTNIENTTINSQEVTDNTRIGDLKPSTYLNASRRHQNRANKSMLSSRDMSLSAMELEKSMVADELFKASRKTKAKVEVILDKVTRQNKDANLKNKLESVGNYERFQALTNMLGLNKLTPKQVKTVSDLLIEWQDKGLENESGLDSSLEAPVVIASENDGQVDVNDLSYEQIKTVTQYIDQLITDSDNIIKNRILNLKTFSDDIATKAEADVANNPNRNNKKADVYSPGGEKHIAGTIDFISGAMDHLKGMNEIVDWYEFGEGSLPRIILHMIKGVGDFAKQGGTFVRDKLWDSTIEKITKTAGLDTLKRIKGYAGQRIIVQEFQGTTAVGQDGKISKMNLIGMLLVKGSADGDQRIKKHGLNPDTLVKTIESHLHRDDIKIVEAIYNVMEFLQPGIAFVEKTLRGYSDVEFVNGNDFEWNGRTIKGGYVHFSYLLDGEIAISEFDKKISESIGDGKQYNTNEAARGYTKEGFKKNRSENVDRLIDFDFDNIVNKTIGNVVTNNTMLIPIVRSMQILNDKRVEKSLKTVMGKNGLQVFKNHIMGAGNGLINDLSTHRTAVLESLGKSLSKVSRNYMLDMILGSVSSVMANVTSWNNVLWYNIDKRPSILVRYPLALLSSMFIPGVHKKLKANLESYIPEVTTTKENYQQNDLKDFSLFKNSKKSNIVTRKMSDFFRGVSEIYFEKVMGTVDSVGKVAYASILLADHVNSMTEEERSNMTEEEIKHKASGAISDDLQRMFPSRDSTSIALMQKHPVGKQLFVFFNDSRIQLNQIYFPRWRNIVRSFTQMPRRVKEKGLGYAIGKGVWDVASNASILHLQSAVIISLIRSFRGEDDEGDKTTNKPWHERALGILKKQLLDPFAQFTAAGDMIPVVNAFLMFYNSDGNYGYVNVPVLQWGKDLFDGIKGLVESKFDWGDMTDKERQATLGILSGVLPNTPMSPIKTYHTTDSTAAKTGAASILGTFKAMYDGVTKLAATVMNDSAEAMVEATEEANDPSIDEEVSNYLMGISSEQYDRLLASGRGRTILKRMLDTGQVAAISEDELNDIIFTESNGDPNARNTYTGAAGIYQFLSSTWNLYLDKKDENGNPAFGHLTQGLSRAYVGEPPDGEIDGRYDPEQSSRMIYIMHNEIAKRLITKGVKPNGENIYMGHHFGESPGVAVWTANDKTSFKTAYMSAFKNKDLAKKQFKSTVAGNGWLDADMTVGEVKEALTALIGRGQVKRQTWENEMGVEYSLDILTQP